MYKLLLTIAFYLPFQLALNPISGVDLASIRVLIIVLCLWWIAEGLRRKNLFIPATLSSGLMIAFLFFHFFSLFMAQNQEWALRKMLFLLSIAPLYFVASDILRNKDRTQQLVKALVAGGTMAGLLGIIQFGWQFIAGRDAVYEFWARYVTVPFLGKSFGEAVLANPSWLVNIGGDTYLRATAAFPDPHMFSFYLGLLIPFSAALFLGATSGTEGLNWKWFPCCAVLVLANFLTFSRGGYLGLSAALVLFFVLAFAAFGSSSAPLSEATARQGKHAKSALLACGILALIFASTPVSKRFFSIFDIKEGSNRGRIETWENAWEAVKGCPLLGVGIGNYPLEVKPNASYRDPIYAHNAYLDIAVETGVLNMLIWIAFLGITAYYLYRRSIHDKIFLAGAFSIFIFSTHSLVETATYSSNVLPLLMLIMSLGNGRDNGPYDSNGQVRKS